MVPCGTSGRICLKGGHFCWREKSTKQKHYGWLAGSQFQAKPRKNNFVLNLEKGMQVFIFM